MYPAPLLLKRGLSGEVNVDGRQLYDLLLQDERNLFPSQDKSVGMPSLKFLISNTSDSAIIVRSLRLSVEQSRLDPQPLWWAKTSFLDNATFDLGNYGWGTATNVKFSFDIVSNTDNTPVCPIANNNGRCFQLALNDVASTDDISVSLWDALGSFSPDAAPMLKDRIAEGNMQDNQPRGEEAEDLYSPALRKLVNAVDGKPEPVSGTPGDPFHSAYFMVIGELSYVTEDGQQASFSISQTIEVSKYQAKPLRRAVMLPSGTYDDKLRADGENYQIVHPLEHSIKAGETERIDLNIWVDKSSIHEMTASIGVGGDWVDAPEKLKLEYYLPANVLLSMQSVEEAEKVEQVR